MSSLAGRFFLFFFPLIHFFGTCGIVGFYQHGTPRLEELDFYSRPSWEQLHYHLSLISLWFVLGDAPVLCAKGGGIGKKTISYLGLFVYFLSSFPSFISWFVYLLFSTPFIWIIIFSFWIMKTLKQASWESYKLYKLRRSPEGNTPTQNNYLIE